MHLKARTTHFMAALHVDSNSALLPVQSVVGSNPTNGSSFFLGRKSCPGCCCFAIAIDLIVDTCIMCEN